MANLSLLIVAVSLIASAFAVFKKDLELINSSTTTTTTIQTTTTTTDLLTTSDILSTTSTASTEMPTTATTTQEMPPDMPEDAYTANYISTLLLIIGALALLLGIIMIIVVGKKAVHWKKKMTQIQKSSLKPSNVSIISSTAVEIEQTDL